MKIRRSSRSNNGISVYEIESNKLIYSTIIVTIYKGINDDPLLYGGTYHYLEHILGAYFEYNKYGWINFK
jgi:secreted Zn-dependent insulinase-like peptidase